MIDRGSRINILNTGLLFLFSVIYLLLFVRVLRRVGDEGLIIYGAQLVAEGALPFRDFMDHVTPGSLYLLALFFKLFGTSFLVARAEVVMVIALTAVLLYWMTRRLYRGPYDMLPALFCLFMSFPLWPANSHHWDSNLFFLLALGIFFLWQDTKSLGYLIAVGVVGGLTSCFMQQKGLFLILSLSLVIIINEFRVGTKKSQIVSHLAIIWAGYAGVGVVVLFLFYLAGSLPDLIFATLTFPAKAYLNANVTSYGYGLFRFLWPFWQKILNLVFPVSFSNILGPLILVPFLFIMALPLLLAISTASYYFIKKKHFKIFDEIMLPYWLSGFALWFAELHRQDINHLAYGSPLLIILIVVTWLKLSANKRLLRNLGVAVVTAGFIWYAAFSCMMFAASNVPSHTRRGTVYGTGKDNVLIFLHENIKSKDFVFIYPYFPMYYFLADLKNPTRFNVMLHWPYTEELFNEAITALERKKVKYVLWDTFADGANLKAWFPTYQQPPAESLLLEKYLGSHYEIIGLESGFKIMQRREGLKEKEG